MRVRPPVVNPRVPRMFAGLRDRLRDQSKLPTLHRFGFGVLALWLVIWGMGQARAGVVVDAVVLVGGGLLLWMWQFGTLHLEDRAFVGSPQLVLRRWWLGGGLAVIALGVAAWAWHNLDVTFTTVADWLWYLASLALLMIAASTMETWRLPVPRAQRIAFGGRVLLGIVVIGALARLLFLGSQPFGTWYDEAANGLEALRVAYEEAYQPIYTDGVNATGHYLWLIVGAFKLFGENTFAVRSISAVMGILTVVAAYAAGRELHNHTVGLALAMLVAVARWSITFSRLGMYNTATPLFELLALYWLLRGLRRGSVLDFVLAGVSIGLGLCFYSAFQLFIGVLGIFVLLVLIREWAQWRVVLLGLLITLVATLVVTAPVIKYAVEKPESYFSRVQTTSLFSGKSPEERLPALWENTRKHLLMFNLQGDPNGRHNLPGEPMLDWVTGGLLVVGVLLSLLIVVRRGISPRYVIVPIWILIGLLGGILSLDFEAPQSLRAIGALPAVLICAALPLSQLVAEWRAGAGRYFPHAGFGVVALIFLLPASVANLHTYFVVQARDFSSWNAHSTPETIAAKVLLESNPLMEKNVISLFDGHPTVRFLARNVSYQRVETNAIVPLLRDMPNGMMLIVDAERKDLFEDTRQIYPMAKYQEIQSPYGGPVVVFVNELTPQDLQSVQGLYGSFASEDASLSPQVQKSLTIDFDWPSNSPIPLPFVADWDGVLAVNTFGPYQFFVEAPGQVTLWIGGSVVIDGDASVGDGLGGELMLARGHHSIRLRAEGGEGRVRLAWQPPDGPPATVPSWSLYVPPVQSNGLLGEYFGNGEWAGEPTFAQISPRLSMYFHVPTLPRPYTIEWRGKLAIPEAGDYEFALQSIDESILLVNDIEVVRSMERNVSQRGGVQLEAGLHDIVVRYADRTNHTYINLTWRPPGGDGTFQQIPSELLFPPQGSYESVNVTDLARFIQPESGAPVALEPGMDDAARVDVVAEGLLQPRGVAVTGDVVYVTDSGNGRVAAFDVATGEEVESPFDGVELVEPFDIAVLDDGSIVVLDAGVGNLWRFHATLGYVEKVAVGSSYLERSRGIGAGVNGEIWIANTPGQRVVSVDADGNVLQEIILPSVSADASGMQPVDVALMDDNTLFVTDVAGHFLYRFSLAGYLLSSQPLSVANALDGAHLAVDSEGMLYLTDPEAGRVVQLDASGVPQRTWSVRTTITEDAKAVGIAVGDDGTIWVADSPGGRLLRVMPESVE